MTKRHNEARPWLGRHKGRILAILRRIPGPFILITSIYLSSMPRVPLLSGAKLSDKLVHLVCFAGLAGAWTWWWPAKIWRRRTLRCALITVFATALYGALDELHQSFVPGREVSALDWLADVSGAALGTAASYFLFTFLPFARRKDGGAASGR